MIVPGRTDERRFRTLAGLDLGLGLGLELEPVLDADIAAARQRPRAAKRRIRGLINDGCGPSMGVRWSTMSVSRVFADEKAGNPSPEIVEVVVGVAEAEAEAEAVTVVVTVTVGVMTKSYSGLTYSRIG